MHALVLTLLLAGCSDGCNLKEIGGGAGWDLTWLPYIDGNVYQCDITVNLDPVLCADAVDGVCTREWCLSEDKGGARELTMLAYQVGYGDVIHCYPTPRHLGPCTDQCDGDTAIGGCNAFHGCWCEP